MINCSSLRKYLGGMEKLFMYRCIIPPMYFDKRNSIEGTKARSTELC